MFKTCVMNWWIYWGTSCAEDWGPIQHSSNWGVLHNSTLLIRQASRHLHNWCGANMWINSGTIMNPFLRAHQSFSKWSCYSQQIHTSTDANTCHGIGGYTAQKTQGGGQGEPAKFLKRWWFKKVNLLLQVILTFSTSELSSVGRSKFWSLEIEVKRLYKQFENQRFFRSVNSN